MPRGAITKFHRTPHKETPVRNDLGVGCQFSGVGPKRKRAFPNTSDCPQHHAKSMERMWLDRRHHSQNMYAWHLSLWTCPYGCHGDSCCFGQRKRGRERSRGHPSPLGRCVCFCSLRGLSADGRSAWRASGNLVCAPRSSLRRGPLIVCEGAVPLGHASGGGRRRASGVALGAGAALGIAPKGRLHPRSGAGAPTSCRRTLAPDASGRWGPPRSTSGSPS